jgi:hypothetical protein
MSASSGQSAWQSIGFSTDVKILSTTLITRSCVGSEASTLEKLRKRHSNCLAGTPHKRDTVGFGKEWCFSAYEPILSGCETWADQP